MLSVRPFQNLAKQNKIQMETMVTTGENAVLPSGSLMTPVLLMLFSARVINDIAVV